jgi:hypothetical protein
MAFFNPLGALSAAGAGAVKGYTEDAPKIYDMMGMQALGRAFQMPQQAPTIAPIPGIGQQGPQAPPPGQPSQPAGGPQPPGPPAGGGGGPPASFSGGAGGPMPPGFVQNGPANPQQMAAAFAALRQGQGTPMGGYQPPQGSPMIPPQARAQAPMGPPQGPPPGMQQGGGGPGPQGPMPGQQQGMPQFDLQTLASRINQANPGLPPQAMVAALTRAVPLLNVQGRQDLMMLRLEMQQQIANAKLSQGDRRLDQGDRRLDRGDERAAESKSEAQDIVDAMKRGDQPPTMTGLYRLAPEVRALAAKQGVDLAKMQQEWSRAQKQILSLNGPQMIRYQGLAHSVVNTIDEVKRLSQEMENSGIPLLNHAKMVAYAQTQGNSPNGQLVAKYMAGINTLKEEFANLAQGGYAPTESAWGLANQQINGDYGVKQLDASLGEVQRLIRYRLEGIPGISTLGTDAPNRYVPGGTGSGGGSQQQPAAGADAPAVKSGGWSIQRVQ